MEHLYGRLSKDNFNAETDNSVEAYANHNVSLFRKGDALYMEKDGIYSFQHFGNAKAARERFIKEIQNDEVRA